VGGELPEGWVDRYPVPQEDLRPGVVIELAVDVGETGIDAGRNAGRARQLHEELRVLVAVAAARAQHLQRSRNAEGDALLERIINPAVDALGDHPRIALPTGQPLGEA